MGLNLTDEECRYILCTINQGASEYWIREYYDKELEIEALHVCVEGVDLPYGITVIPRLVGKDGKASKFSKSQDFKKFKRFVIGIGDIREAAERLIGPEDLVGTEYKSILVSDRGGADRWVSDAIFQIALFGELHYG